MTSNPGPVVQRELLIKELRSIRHGLGRAEQSVADDLGWAASKLVEIEGGVRPVAPEDLQRLLQSYGVTDNARLEHLLALAQAAAEPGWWQSYEEDIDDEPFFGYLQFEDGAALIRQFQCLVLPGLLQTPEYARMIVRQYFPLADEARVDSLVKIRQTRQRNLRGRQQNFVLDEAAIRRTVGNREIMRGQLARLLEMSEEEGVTLQVLPLSSGESVCLKGPFALLDFENGLDGVLHLERTPQSLTYFRSCADTAAYRAIFFDIQEKALSDQRSREFIRDVLGSL